MRSYAATRLEMDAEFLFSPTIRILVEAVRDAVDRVLAPAPHPALVTAGNLDLDSAIPVPGDKYFIYRSGNKTRRFKIRRSKLKIGSGRKNNFNPKHPSLDAKHAVLNIQKDLYPVLEDLKSHGGTMVNGKKIMGPTLLSPGDVVTFGALDCLFAAGDYVEQNVLEAEPHPRPHGLPDIRTFPRADDFQDGTDSDEKLLNATLRVFTPQLQTRLSRVQFDPADLPGHQAPKHMAESEAVRLGVQLVHHIEMTLTLMPENHNRQALLKVLGDELQFLIQLMFDPGKPEPKLIQLRIEQVLSDLVLTLKTADSVILYAKMLSQMGWDMIFTAFLAPASVIEKKIKFLEVSNLLLYSDGAKHLREFEECLALFFQAVVGLANINAEPTDSDKWLEQCMGTSLHYKLFMDQLDEVVEKRLASNAHARQSRMQRPKQRYNVASKVQFMPGRVEEQYQLIRCIGQGGFSKVYLAESKTDGQRVAVKKMLENFSQHKISTLNEIGILTVLRHPNIVQLEGAYLSDDIASVVMELCDLGVLSSHLVAPLPEDAVLNIIQSVCSALAYVHSLKIIHRDVKSDNVFLAAGGIVKLGDVGVACEMTRGMKHGMSGSAHWMAPEMIRRNPYNEKVDIWSTGALMVELMTRKPPSYQSSRLKALFDHATKGIPPLQLDAYSTRCQSICSHCFLMDPEARPAAARLLQFEGILASDVVFFFAFDNLISPKGFLAACTPEILLQRLASLVV